MADSVVTLRPGILIALLCLLLVAALGIVAIRDARRKKVKAAERKVVVEKAMAGIAPETSSEIDMVW